MAAILFDEPYVSNQFLRNIFEIDLTNNSEETIKTLSSLKRIITSLMLLKQEKKKDEPEVGKPFDVEKDMRDRAARGEPIDFDIPNDGPELEEAQKTPSLKQILTRKLGEVGYYNELIEILNFVNTLNLNPEQKNYYNKALGELANLETSEFKKLFNKIKSFNTTIEEEGIGYNINKITQSVKLMLMKPFPKAIKNIQAESKNLLERLIREELKVLNGKKMVRN